MMRLIIINFLVGIGWGYLSASLGADITTLPFWLGILLLVVCIVNNTFR